MSGSVNCRARSLDNEDDFVVDDETEPMMAVDDAFETIALGVSIASTAVVVSDDVDKTEVVLLVFRDSAAAAAFCLRSSKLRFFGSHFFTISDPPFSAAAFTKERSKELDNPLKLCRPHSFSIVKDSGSVSAEVDDVPFPASLPFEDAEAEDEDGVIS